MANYGKAIAKSIQNDWDRSNEDGIYVFTSSGGVYKENSGGVIDELSPVTPNDEATERTKVILEGEEAVLAEAAGVVVRLGGLYTKKRGAHNFWLSGKMSEFQSSPNGLINLIHYDDAAECVLKALLNMKKETKEKLFLVSDGPPISRIDICKAGVKNPDYADRKIPNFLGDPDKIDGKRYDSKTARRVLGWEPKFQSFDAFMSKDYAEEKTVELLNWSE